MRLLHKSSVNSPRNLFYGNLDCTGGDIFGSVNNINSAETFSNMLIYSVEKILTQTKRKELF